MAVYKRYLMDHIDTIALFLCSFCVYCITLCPTIYVGDSGELTAAALTLGIAHPPGYPLYVILGKLFSMLVPAQSGAFEMNLFSAWWGAWATVMFYLVLRTLQLSRMTSIGTSLVFAFLNLFWSQAVVARVYTLNAFLMLCALLCLFRYYLLGDRKYIYLYFFMLGLGLANHTIAIITVPLFFVMVTSSKRLYIYHPVNLLKYVVCLIPGLLMYAYLPLRALSNPAINWGNPGTSKNFFDFVFRKEFWDRAYVENGADVMRVIIHYLSLIPREYLYFGLIFLIIGIIHSFRQFFKIGLALILLYAFNIFFMIMHASRSDIYYWPRYVIAAFISLTIWIGFGVQSLIKSIGSRQLSFVLPFILPVCMFALNFHKNDRSDNYLAEDINKIILNQLPANAILAAQGDNVLFPISYFHYVENMRPDITLYAMGMNELHPFRFQPKANPTFFTHYNELGTSELSLLPRGLVYQVATQDMKVEPITDPKLFHVRNLDDKPVYFDYLCRCLAGDYYFMRAANFHEIAFEDALPYYNKALKIAYDNDVMHYNMGLVFLRENMFQEAIDQFNIVLSIDSKNQRAKAYIERLSSLLKSIVTRTASISGDKPQTAAKYAQWMYKADVAMRTGDMSGTIACTKKVLAIKPDFIQAWKNLAVAYIFSGDHRNARSALENIIKIDKTNRFAEKNLAWLTNLETELQVLHIFEDTEGLAQDDRNRIVDILSKKSIQQFRANSETNKPTYEALMYLTVAERIDPQSVRVHKNLGALYINFKRYSMALKEFQKILDIDPDDKDAAGNIKRLRKITSKK